MDSNSRLGGFTQQDDKQTMSSQQLYYPCSQSNLYFGNGDFSNYNVNHVRPNIHVNPKKIHYNPKFLSTNQTAVPYTKKSNQLKVEKIHINPKYFSSSTNGTGNSSAIHINRNFLVESTSTNNANSIMTNVLNSYPSVSENNNSIKSPNSRYKLINSGVPDENKPSVTSKYKYINKTAVQPKKSTSEGIKLKSKYSIRRTTTNVVPTQIKNPLFIKTKADKKRLSTDFQKVSKTKLIRKSTLKAQVEKRRRKGTTSIYSLKNGSHKRKSLVTKYKLIRSNKTSKIKVNDITSNLSMSSPSSQSSESVFKSVTLLKLVRKSVLQKHIESRRQVRKTIPALQKIRGEIIINQKPITSSQYRLIRSISPSKLKMDNKKQGKLLKLNQLKKVNIIKNMTKRLRKDNQLCAFYNRFGRCKGKDRGTCTKIHDPKYIAICKKLLQSECSDKDCLLSHDVRPEKMPTCLHYLSGLCTRSDCPFLHIKVNPKAPVCTLFLQGFCADVYNCTKRHEYICPIFADKGTCPKGKSCVYPHKSHTIRSKLLASDQNPLILNPLKNNYKPNSVPKKKLDEVSSSQRPLVTKDATDSKSEDPKVAEGIKKIDPQNDESSSLTTTTTFTRYFTTPFTFDPNCDTESMEYCSTDDSDS